MIAKGHNEDDRGSSFLSMTLVSFMGNFSDRGDDQHGPFTKLCRKPFSQNNGGVEFRFSFCGVPSISVWSIGEPLAAPICNHKFLRLCRSSPAISG